MLVGLGFPIIVPTLYSLGKKPNGSPWWGFNHLRVSVFLGFNGTSRYWLYWVRTDGFTVFFHWCFRFNRFNAEQNQSHSVNFWALLLYIFSRTYHLLFSFISSSRFKNEMKGCRYDQGLFIAFSVLTMKTFLTINTALAVISMLIKLSN
jgi:hypothetical protein